MTTITLSVRASAPSLVAQMPSELDTTDLFCGAGGEATGLVEAGYRIVYAINHSKVALATHQANHGDAEHLLENLDNFNYRRLKRTRILWGSPICTEVSPSGGKKRHRRNPDQLALELEAGGKVDKDLYERTRATAYSILRAVEVHRYDVVMCENVLEFATDWELFWWWIKAMEILGYNHQIVSVSSAHVGDDDNLPAPQWRDRIYIVFTRKGIRKPDLKPRPRAWCLHCEKDVRAVQAWRNGHKLGKYKQQYDYRCPNTRCGHALVEPYVRPASSVIDWSNLGVRIADRTAHGLGPLVPNTRRRIQVGLDMLGARNMMLTVNHGGHDGRAYLPETRPLASRTAKIGDALLVPTGGTWNETPTVTGEPCRTRLANEKGYEALCTPPDVTQDPFVVEYRNHGSATSVGRPLSTVSAQGNHHGLVIPYRKARTKTTGEPILTIATRDSAGLVPYPVPEIDECFYRMVQPREQLGAQRFPHDYIVRGTGGEQTLQAGNAVSVNVARWIGRQVAAVLS